MDDGTFNKLFEEAKTIQLQRDLCARGVDPEGEKKLTIQGAKKFRLLADSYENKFRADGMRAYLYWNACFYTFWEGNHQLAHEYARQGLRGRSNGTVTSKACRDSLFNFILKNVLDYTPPNFISQENGETI